MKNLYYTILILTAFSISIIMTSCCADNECAEEDIYGKTIVRQTDTLYNKVPKVERGPFSVQVGAFANKSYADAFLRDAKSELRMDVTMTQTKDGLYRILVGEYKTLTEAEEVLQAVKRKGFNDSFTRDSYGPINK
ncbi:MAG: SPOR domain-containing protein [Ignavibacteria bacterium]